MDLDRETLARARVAVREAVRHWIYDPNVTFVDFGWRERSGKLVKDEFTVRVHVIEKYATGPALEAAIDKGETRGPIPDSILGFPVDRPKGAYKLNQWMGGWYFQHATKRARRIDPMQGGISISDANRNSYATLGCLVKDRETGKEMILSNWHVLAASWSAQHGLPIYQPGRGDGGRDADTVARFSRHAMESGLDAAVAELTGSRQLINKQFELGAMKGVSRAEIGMEVAKSGRKTGVTHGIVTSLIKGTFKMKYRGVDRLLQNVLTIEPRPPFNEVSAGGDSGSVWCQESTMQAVALHFAGMDQPERALAIDIQPILDALNVEIVY